MSESKLTFFRQSGWMMIATTLGGVFMWLVHIPAQHGMPKDQYGVFLSLLQVLNLMMIPAIGLQTVFARQAAAVVTPKQEDELAWLVRAIGVGVTVIWFGMLALGAFYRDGLLAHFQIKSSSPAAFWTTLVVGLPMLWMPIVLGVLQGKQNFLWMGWCGVFNGVGRFLAVLILVTMLAWDSAGAMVAALIGFLVAVTIGCWQCRAVLTRAGQSIDWKAWLAKVIPLTLGLGASQFMMSVDQIVMTGSFPTNVTALYGAAGMIGRALVIFTMPMVSVMFPKVVASTVRTEDSSAAAQALGATLLMGGLAALACTIMPSLPLKLVYKQEYWGMAPLVPWFAWCMLPLTLANVLIGNLLAKERFAAVPWLIVVTVAYALGLKWRVGHAVGLDQMVAFKTVVQTIGMFSLALLAVAAWFTWGWRGPKNGATSSSQPAQG